MNNKLTNLCDYNAAHLGEALGYQMRSGRKVRNLFLLAAAFMILVYSLCVWLIGGESKYWATAALSLVMMGLLGITNFIMPRLTAKSQAAKIKELNGGSAFAFEFLEEHLQMSLPSGEKNEPIPYEELTRAVRTKSLVLLFTRAATLLILDRSGFRNGTEEDFWTLLTEKCPSVQVKKK